MIKLLIIIMHIKRVNKKGRTICNNSNFFLKKISYILKRWGLCWCHGGYKLKEEIKNILKKKDIEYKDYGTNSEERTDYPIYAKKVAEAIQNKECDCGILVCRSGYGMTVVANKFKGIRAAAVHDEESAKFAKSR